MINNNPQNLKWHVHPHHQFEGYWFTIKPTPESWQTIEKIQEFAGKKLKEEGINNWAAYPYHLAHITVFLGLSDKTTEQEKSLIMKRVANKISQLKNFDINFQVKDAKIGRGPGKFLTLHFDTPQTKVINEKIKEAIKEAIACGEFDRRHLQQDEKGDKLDRKFKPHLSLGVIDLEDNMDWSKKPKDIKAFLNKNNSAQFETKVKGAFANDTIKFPVKNIDLLGSNHLSKFVTVNNKNHTKVASCALNTQEFRYNEINNTRVRARITNEARDAVKNPNLKVGMRIEEIINSNGTIETYFNVGFENLQDAINYNQGIVFSNDNDFHWVRLKGKDSWFNEQIDYNKPLDSSELKVYKIKTENDNSEAALTKMAAKIAEFLKNPQLKLEFGLEKITQGDSHEDFINVGFENYKDALELFNTTERSTTPAHQIPGKEGLWWVRLPRNMKEVYGSGMEYLRVLSILKRT